MFVRILSLLLLLIVSHVGLAQPLPDRKPLTGVALDGDSKPVSGAYISIRRQDGEGSYAFWGAAVSADGKGQFRFPQAETGRYYLNAEAPGFAPVYNLAVVWKNGASPLKVPMNRLVNLQLALTLPDGSPARDLPIWVRLRGDGYAGQSTNRLVSGNNGIAIIPDLQPANYSLFLFSSAGYVIRDQFTLRANGVQVLHLKAGGTLHVSVQDGGATPRGLGGATLSLIPQDPSEALNLMGQAASPSEDFALLAAMGKRLPLVSRDGDGNIMLTNVPPGRYTAKILGSAFARQAARPVTIVANQTETIKWAVAPKAGFGAALELHLSDSSGKAAAGEFELRMLPLQANGSLATDEISDDAPGGTAGRRVIVDENGRATLYPIAPGRYRFFVSPARPVEAEEDIAESASVDVSVPPTGTTAKLTVKTNS